MSSLQQISILGSDAGLRLDIKPYLIPEKAFSTLENAYVWRERVIKKQGFEFLGRLRRNFIDLSLGNSAASVWAFNIWTTLVPPIVPEATAEIEAGSVRINIEPNPITGAVTVYSNNANCRVTSIGHPLITGDVISISGVTVKPGTGDNLINGGPYTITRIDANLFDLNVDSTQWGIFLGPGIWTREDTLAEILIDQGDGTLATNPVSATVGTINYLTGDVTITNGTAGQPTIISFNYFPGLPVMGIWQQEQPGINDEVTLYWDTKYVYDFTGTGFNEFLPSSTWDGSDSDFFWGTNYRGVTADIRLFFVTNFFNSATVPMRYTDGITWNAFTPQVNNTGTLILQARIIIPYYGRLVLLNTIEGNILGGGNNFFNRCRFSQIGNPLEAYNFAANPQTGAFAEDIFGKGGFIDAPTNEQIISAAFFKNTLIVYFERSVWQLRYVGEYGLPFLWERVSSDFGSESTFSTVLFDDAVLGFGDRAIIQCNSVQASRIDEVIPDVVFDVLNDQNGPKRVVGVRDFQRELVFWTYPDAISLAESQYFPNKVLVYNYRNNTWARFDDNVTFFGTMQPTGDFTWDSTEIFWDDDNVTWDDFDLESRFPRIVAGNQQGFIGFYGYVLPDETSLFISAIDLVSIPNQITVPFHNLQSGEIFRITGTLFDGVDPGLNDKFYKVQFQDKNTIALLLWNGTSFVNSELTPGGTYIGNGKLTVYPRPNIVTKDFNPFLNQGMNTKLSYIDFLMDATADSAVSVQVFANASPAIQANLILGSFKFSTNLTLPYYGPDSDYVWFRFYAGCHGQFLRIALTYGDDLMTDLDVLSESMVLNAMKLYVRPGGKSVF